MSTLHAQAGPAKVGLPVACNVIFATAALTFIFAWNDNIFALVLIRTEILTLTVPGWPPSAQPMLWANIIGPGE